MAERIRAQKGTADKDIDDIAPANEAGHGQVEHRSAGYDGEAAQEK